MSSSTSNILRSRSLRVPPASSNLKLTSSSTAQPGAGPSYVSLFLTNLRLLDIDLREDWPDITVSTFSTKDQNQKKKIQCVEWALFQLFALWDPEETRNKLQPFFPPLEQLQSLNLRAALFRCLDQAKKNGFLGRDTVLRKTMLDECKGERLEEVLAVFSNVVLKKVLERNSRQDRAIAKELALENFSYTGERSMLSTLIVAHKASLSRHLRDKNDAKARYHDFADLLNLNERRIARRHEQLKEVIKERRSGDQISGTEVGDIQGQVRENWSGNDKWLDTILYGDTRPGEGLLATRFDKVWRNFEAGSIGDVESINQVGLLEQLDARVRDQENRLARWQDFGRKLNEGGSASPSKKNAQELAEQNKIDLGFNRHETLQIGRKDLGKSVDITAPALKDYNRLIENMKSELADVGKEQVQSKRANRQSLASERRRSSIMVPPAPTQEDPPSEKDDEWSSASDAEEPSPAFSSYATKSMSQTPPSEAPVMETKEPEQHSELKKPALPNKKISYDEETPKVTPSKVISQKDRSPSPSPLARTPPPIEHLTPTRPVVDSEAALADEILNSMSAASPSPKKARHTLSLAERTRLSMSRSSHSQFSDLHDEFEVTDLPHLSLKPRHSSPLNLQPKTLTKNTRI